MGHTHNEKDKADKRRNGMKKSKLGPEPLILPMPACVVPTFLSLGDLKTGGE